MKTELWRTIGFQSKNPRTDFRAGGILALLALHHFVRTEPALFEEMKQHAQTHEDWFIAISSINVTSQLITYLHLTTEPVPLSHLNLKAARPQFKNFARLNAKDKRTFFELHNHAFRLLFTVWKKAVAENNNSRLPPNFQFVINTTIRRVDRVLESNQFKSLVDLKIGFERDLFALERQKLIN